MLPVSIAGLLLSLPEFNYGAPRMRHLFFLINFGGAVLFLVVCVSAVGAMETPFSFLGGIVFFPHAAAFAAAEWVGWYRRNRTATKVLGIICLALSAFAVFGIIANVAEALSAGWPSGFEWFVVVAAAIAVYLLCCGLYRVWPRTSDDHSGRGT